MVLSLLFKTIVCLCCIFHGAIADGEGCNVPCDGNKVLICYRVFFFTWNSCEIDNSVRGIIPFTCGCCDQNDEDADGICDANDMCPGSDDLDDTNENGIPDGCEPLALEDPPKLPSGRPTPSPSVSPSVQPNPSPSSLPTDGPTISPTDFPTMLPTISPSEFPTTAPTNDPTTIIPQTEQPSERPCAVAVSLRCRAEGGQRCSTISRRKEECLVTLAYDITVCNKFDELVKVTAANILLNGQSFDVLPNIEPLLPSRQCQTITPRVEVNVCDPVALLAEIIVSIGDCGDSDSVKLSI